MSDVYQRDVGLSFHKRGCKEEPAPEDYAEIVRQSSFFESPSTR